MIENGIEKATERVSPISKAGPTANETSLSVAHLNFLGQGLARLVHDLKNHLAVINESAGLMADFLKLEQKQRSGWTGRLFKRGRRPGLDITSLLGGVKRIEKDVVQGAVLIQHLGRFAHRLNEVRTVFDGNEALEEIRDVLLEQASEKGLSLEIRLSKTTPMVETDPLGFQMVLLYNVEKVMAGLKPGHRVTLEAAVRESLVQFRLSCPYPETPPGFASEELRGEDFYRGRLEELGGQIWYRSSHGKYAVTLAFPLAGGKI